MMRRIFSLLLALCLLLPCLAHAEDSAEDDWYLEKAALLANKLHEMISFEGFAEFYTGSEEVIALIDSWKAAMDAEPRSAGGYDLPPMELISEFVPEMENIPASLIEKVERGLGTTLIAQINGRAGVSFIAASSMTTRPPLQEASSVRSNTNALDGSPSAKNGRKSGFTKG